MPADERATLTRLEHARAVMDQLVRFELDYGYECEGMATIIEQALKSADRLAREDAARMGDEKAQAARALADACGLGARAFEDKRWHTAQASAFREMSAAIRASITTDEGE